MSRAPEVEACELAVSLRGFVVIGVRRFHVRTKGAEVSLATLGLIAAVREARHTFELASRLRVLLIARVIANTQIARQIILSAAVLVVQHSGRPFAMREKPDYAMRLQIDPHELQDDVPLLVHSTSAHAGAGFTACHAPNQVRAINPQDGRDFSVGDRLSHARSRWLWRWRRLESQRRMFLGVLGGAPE